MFDSFFIAPSGLMGLLASVLSATFKLVLLKANDGAIIFWILLYEVFSYLIVTLAGVSTTSSPLTSAMSACRSPFEFALTVSCAGPKVGAAYVAYFIGSIVVALAPWPRVASNLVELAYTETLLSGTLGEVYCFGTVLEAKMPLGVSYGARVRAIS